MTIEHVILTDPYLHEPKGVALANDGEVYVADGVGSGAWKKYVQDTAHGSMTITNNTTAKELTAAVDATFNTDTDYTVLSSTGAPWVGENLHNITFFENRLTVDKTGVYKLDFWITVNSWAAANTSVAFKYRKNGSDFSPRKIAVKTNAASDRREAAASGLVELAAGDYIQIYVAASDTGNYTFNDCEVSMLLVREIV